MIKRVYLTTVVSLILVLTLSVPVALAQEGSTSIEYGQTVTGQITNKAFEVMYTFKGDASDVVIISMSLAGASGGLSQPGIILLNSAGEVIANISYSYSKTVRLSTQLPTKGDYTIVATRLNGRIGKSVGKFNLSLSKPKELTVGTPVNGTIVYGDSASTTGNYYSIEATGPFKILYQTVSGIFNPTVSINVIESGNFKNVATLSGNEVSEGEIGITAKLGTTYIVIVGGQLPNKNKVEYTVTLTAKK